MKDTVKRAVRTFFQGAVGVFLLAAIGPLNNLIQSAVNGEGTANVDLNLWGNILLACLAGGIIALVSFAQNLLEDQVPKIDTR